MISVIFRVITALGISLFISLFLIQQDPWFLQYAQNHLNQIMSDMYRCHFTAHLAQCKILSGTVVCAHAKVYDCDNGSWSWHADKIILQWSWLDLLFAKKCAVATTVINMKIESSMSYAQDSFSLAILPHFLLLLAPTQIDIPFTFNQCILKKVFLNLREVAAAVSLRMLIDLEAKIADDGTWLSLLYEQGSCQWSGKSYLTTAEGAAHFFIPLDKYQDKLHGSAHMRALVQVNDALVGLKAQASLKKDRFQVIMQDIEEQYQLKGFADKKIVHGQLIWHEQKEKKQVAWVYNPVQQAIEITVVPEGMPSLMSPWCSHISGVLSKDHILLKAYAPERLVELAICIRPTLHIQSIIYCEDGIEVINAQGNANGFKGMIPWQRVQNLLKRYTNIQATGEGELHYAGNAGQEGLAVDIEMHDSCVRLANTYTILKGLKGSLYVDVINKTAVLRDGMLDLHKGVITCSKATAVWDSVQGTLSLVHVPLLFNKCFIGLKKQLFAQVSGYITGHYQAGLPSVIQGLVMVDQAHIRGNILSAEFQQDVLEAFTPRSTSVQSTPSSSLDCQLDVYCQTKRPVEAKTPFLDGLLIGKVTAQGTLSSPLINGQLHFMRGTLHFPYRPLFIQKGSITLRSQVPDDPLIELLARNRIKQYDVELLVGGSVLSPSINFNSSPSLEQAQIITLLLGGSDDGSLYFLMPKVMTETLESLLFGSSETTTRVQKYMQSLFHPIKKVNIIPRLSDQAGRGGVRGSLELEVNERLRCMIENNMSLSEDVVIEVAYDVSDDLTMRAKRDERGDLGIEGEMHWKF